MNAHSQPLGINYGGIIFMTATKTIPEVGKASVDVRNFIRGNGYLPELITVGGLQVNRASFLRMVCASILELTKPKDKQLNILTDTYPNPNQKTDNVQDKAQLQKQDYLELANAINTFIKGNGYAPELYTTRYGQLSFYGVVWTMSRILAWYYENKALPNYVTLYNTFKQKKGETWLQLEQSLGKQFNTPEELANILRNHPDYEYYYNDMKTPSQTLAALKVVGKPGANCVDVSQVVMKVLKEMGESNVNILRGTFKCGGHVWVTYGPNNTVFDAAGMMKYGYPIGRYMCSGTPWDVQKNPSWAVHDDGVT